MSAMIGRFGTAALTQRVPRVRSCQDVTDLLPRAPVLAKEERTVLATSCNGCLVIPKAKSAREGVNTLIELYLQRVRRSRRANFNEHRCDQTQTSPNGYERVSFLSKVERDEAEERCLAKAPSFLVRAHACEVWDESMHAGRNNDAGISIQSEFPVACMHHRCEDGPCRLT
ncbi:hypothetical protein BaRGS_00020474 [Batillaria attramentaria]|uniref:Uncharacterized protein n=1 Tax=Batillaria attramentaria TaxID=370345 RepID=A0ABD0KMS8_9CAEN